MFLSCSRHMLHLLPKRQNEARLAYSVCFAPRYGGFLHYFSSSLKLLTARQVWSSVGFSAWTFLLGRGWSECTGAGGQQKETGVWECACWKFTITPEASKQWLLALDSCLQRAWISPLCFLAYTKNSSDHLAQMAQDCMSLAYPVLLGSIVFL